MESLISDSNKHGEDDFPPVILRIAISNYLFLSIVGIVGNLLAYFVLSKASKLKHFTTTFLINICIVDMFISCVFAMMLAICVINSKEPYTDDTCKAFAYVRYAGSMACMLMLTAIVFNRFVSLAWTKKYSDLFTSENICKMIFVIWLFPVTLLILPAFGKAGRYAYDSVTGTCDLLYNNLLKEFSRFFIIVLCPAIIIVFFGIMAVLVVQRKNGWTCSENATELPGNSRNKNWSKLDPALEGSESRLLLFLFLIFAVTFFCYVPIFYVRTVRNREDYYLNHVLINSLFFFASAIKPVIYFAMSKNYRIKNLFTSNEEPFPSN